MECINRNFTEPQFHSARRMTRADLSRGIMRSSPSCVIYSDVSFAPVTIQGVKHQFLPPG